MTIRAVVFDFDGVIIDSEVTNFAAWTETYVRYGAELTIDEYLAAMGGHHINVYDLLATKTTAEMPDETTVRASKRLRHLELLAGTGPLPGLTDWILDARAAGLKIGIASSADGAWIDENLQRIGLADAFDCICCWDGDIAPKPAPDLYLRACERLGVPPAMALAVEDSPTGLLAATQAGLRTIGVTHQITMNISLAADLVIGSLGDLSLTEALGRLELSE